MKKMLLSILTVLICLATKPSFSQSSPKPNLELVKQLIAKNKYDQAHHLLHSYVKSNSNDPYVYWLYAHTSQKLGQKSLAYQNFKKAIALSDKNRNLNYDYANTLFSNGKYSKATKLFNDIITDSPSKDSLYYQALVMKGYSSFYQGNFNKSLQTMESVLAVDPSLDYIKTFMKDVRFLKAPFLKIDLDYAKDDQPLDTWKGTITTGFLGSQFFNPTVEINTFNFKTEESKSAVKASLSNVFLVPDIGIKLKATVGVYQHFTSKSNSLVGGLSMDKDLGKELTVKLFAERNSYIGTKFSASQIILQDQLGAGLVYDNPRAITINAQYGYSLFEDKNTIESIGAWFISKPIPTGLVKWRIGYAFNYANAKDMRYIPNGNTDELVQQYPVGSQLPGIYSPYYTPSEELIHSAIADLKLSITQSFNLNGKVTYGFQAENNFPMIFEDQTIETEYKVTTYKGKYNPFTWRIGLDKDFSQKAMFSIYYQRQKTVYYKQDMAGISLYFKFL